MTDSPLKRDLQQEEREISALVTHLWENTETLARQELALGLKEVDLRVDKLKSSLLSGVIAGGFILAGSLVLLAALVIGLSYVMQPWLAALIVGAVVSAIGWTMIMRKTEPDAAAAVEGTSHSTRTMKEAIK